jgi:hypothetical protein
MKMTSQINEPNIVTQDSPLTLPQQFVTPPPEEAGEIRMIRRSQWESLKRCVGRIRPYSSPGASWTSFLAGVAVSGLIGLITVRYTIATKAMPDSTAQAMLFWLTVFAAICTALMWKMEQRERKNRADHLDALKDEMNAIDSYMTKTKP